MQYPSPNLVGPLITELATWVANATNVGPSLQYAEAFTAYF